MNWPELEELYRASKSDNKKVRDAALSAIESNIDAWITEYLALPENSWDWDGQPGGAFMHARKGKPRFTNYDDLATWTTNWIRRGAGEWEHYRKRAEELKSDRLGIVLRHRKHEQAKKLHRHDWTFVTIFGDKYMLDLTPALAPGDIAPQYEEFVLPDTEIV
jgi:hypothetical protein